MQLFRDIYFYSKNLWVYRKNLSPWVELRHFLDWRGTLLNARTPIGDMQPWMSYSATSFIDKHLAANDVIFEYGGGGSTLYFLSKGAVVYTIEHDEDWFEKLSSQVSDKGFTDRWHGKLIEPEAISYEGFRDVSDPDLYQSSVKEYALSTFKNYASAIDDHDEYALDFVIIDGRARPSCIKHAAKKVKASGFLVLDNADRSHYITRKTIGFLDGFDLVVGDRSPCSYIREFIITKIWIHRR